MGRHGDVGTRYREGDRRSPSDIQRRRANGIRARVGLSMSPPPHVYPAFRMMGRFPIHVSALKGGLTYAAFMSSSTPNRPHNSPTCSRTECVSGITNTPCRLYVGKWSRVRRILPM